MSVFNYIGQALQYFENPTQARDVQSVMSLEEINLNEEKPNPSSSFFRKVTNLASSIYDTVADSPSFTQVALTVALLGFSFFPVYCEQRALDKDVAYAVARGAGAALKHL